MLGNLSSPVEKKTLDKSSFSNKSKAYKCAQPNCNGFACPNDVRCNMCRNVPSFSNYLSESETQHQNSDSSFNVAPSKRLRTCYTSYLIPLNILSIGRSGIFDARAEPCCVNSFSISCRVKVEGLWTEIAIKPEDVQKFIFCESLQVIFVKPHENHKPRLLKILKLADNLLIKWIILVFREPLANGSLYISKYELDIFANSVRQKEGVCKMDFTVDEAKKLLYSCGLRLPRADVKKDTNPTTSETSSSNSVSFSKIHYPKISSNISKKESDSSQSKCGTDGGLLTNVINLLSKSNSHPADQNNCQLSAMTKVDQLIEDTDDLIILSEETIGDNRFKSKSIHSHPDLNVNHNSDPDLFSIGEDETFFKFDYKPPGSTDSVTLTNHDLKCLAPGALLNDTIINFYLKYLYFEQLTQTQQQATYLFNVFFYSRLAGCYPSCETPITNAVMALQNPTTNTSEFSYETMLTQHASVSKWTRRVDLFSKDYIIIPINECAHWFLGLVCYPWMAGMVSYNALYRKEVYHLCQLTEKFVNVDEIDFHTNPKSSIIGEECIERHSTDSPGEAFDRWRRRRLAWLRKCGVNAMPCILLFDSLPCQSRVTNLHVIRNYLQAEWNTRRATLDGELRFDKDTIRGFSPRVPVQSNLVDCGIYLLHYVEMFFKKPVRSYTKNYFQHEMASWFPEATVEQKRSHIQEILVRLRAKAVQSFVTEDTN